MATVTFYPGDGTEEQVEVAYLGEFPKRQNGTCAFCHGDPGAEVGGDTPIARYYQRNPWGETCPMCQGRPS